MCLEHHQAPADADANRFRTAGSAQLGEDRRGVELDGVLADAEGRGDLLICQPLGQELQDFGLALGERFYQRLVLTGELDGGTGKQ